MPPNSRKPAGERTEGESLDTAAYKFIRRHRWTQKEVAALPEISRSIVTPRFLKQQAK